MVDIDERSEAAGWPYTPRPDEGFAVSPAFSGDESTGGALRAGYAGLTDLVWGRLPTFDEAIAIIRDNRDLI
jgi:hypothetical protein